MRSSRVCHYFAGLHARATDHPTSPALARATYANHRRVNSAPFLSYFLLRPTLLCVVIFTDKIFMVRVRTKRNGI